MTHPAVVTLVRALGAVHASVGLALVSNRAKVPLALVVGAGCAVFWFGDRYRHLPWRALALRTYVVPVACPALYHLWELDPTDWEAGGEALWSYIDGVARGTPAFVYLVVLACSCLSAADRLRRPL